jgi:CRP-like cAMP-binding protein
MVDVFLQLHPHLSAADLEAMRQRCQPFAFPKGQLVHRRGQVCRALYFLETGLVRCFDPRSERTLWCEFERNFFFLPQSFFRQVPAAESLICLEACTGFSITYRDLTELYAESHPWAQWGVRFMEQQYLKIEAIYASLFYQGASTRYAALLQAQPDVLQRVPLQYIASFLGISPVSLSRIRAGKQLRGSKAVS